MWHVLQKKKEKWYFEPQSVMCERVKVRQYEMERHLMETISILVDNIRRRGIPRGSSGYALFVIHLSQKYTC